MKPFITSLVLACVLVQTVFGGLRDTVVICLGGGHDHAAAQCTPAPAACCEGCSHNDQWPAAAVDEEHKDCGCTDIELALIELLSTPRTIDNDDATPAAPSAGLPYTNTLAHLIAHPDRAPPPSQFDHARDTEHTAGTLRLAIVRSTRLLL